MMGKEIALEEMYMIEEGSRLEIESVVEPVLIAQDPVADQNALVVYDDEDEEIAILEPEGPKIEDLNLSVRSGSSLIPDRILNM